MTERLKPIVDAVWRLLLCVAYRLALCFYFVFRPHREGAFVALWNENRLLMIRNSYRPRLNLPAGGVKKNENPRDAAVRELREELGVEIDPGDLIFFGEFFSRCEYMRDHISLFEVHCERAPALRVDNREVVWAGFLDPNEVPEPELWPVLRGYLARKSKRAGTPEGRAHSRAPC